MPTTFQVDDSIATRFRDAVENKYGQRWGNIGKEVKAMFEDRIKILESKEYNPEV